MAGSRIGRGFSRDRRGRLRWLRLALLSGISLSAVTAHAQTWVGGNAGDPNEWVESNNWSPATVPTATATFGASATTTVANDNGVVIVGGISFTAAAPTYTINGDNTFIINGAGIVNSSVSAQTFNVNPLDNGSALVFQSFATANAGVGSVTYNNFAGGFIVFLNTSNAGNSGTTFTNNGIIQFFDTSAGGSAHINNNVQVDFFDSSSAASATITNAATGTVTFNNSATAGSATINNSGALQFNNSSTAGSASIINNAGGTIDFFNTSSAGAAGLNSAGTVTFHDASTAGSGATLTNHGSMNFNDSSSLASSAISNYSALNFNNSSNAGNASALITNNSGGTVTFANSASAGSSTLLNNSGGNTNFTNSSTAGSSAIDNFGTVTFGDSSTASTATITTESGGQTQFGNTSTGGQATFITNAGGSFDISLLTSGGMTAGSIAGAGNIFLGANVFTVGGNSTSTTVSGVISDGGVGLGTGGGLTKVGTGVLTLSGTNTYTGNTNVNGGALNVTGSIAASALTTVNSGGELFGTGTVGNTSVASGGVFLPGSGTAGSSMTVTGNLGFAAGSTYAIFVNPTTASFSTVTGTATLGGATVNAAFLPGSYISKQYTILTAGSVSGTFGSLINSGLPYGFADSLSYDATHAYLNLTLVFSSPSGGLNTNQQNVANALINSFNTIGGIPVAFTGLTPGQLSQLSGEVGAGFAQGAFQAGNSFLNLMLNPFINGRFGSAGFGAIGYADEPRRKSAAEAAFASAMPKKVPSFDERYSIWGSAFGGSGNINGNATTGSNNTKSQTYGFAAGLDYRLTPDTLLGFALAGGGTHWSLDQGLGSGRSDLFQAGVYGMMRWGAAYLSATAAYSFHDVSTSRTVTIAGTDTLGAGFRANAFGGRLEGGYRFAAPWLGVTPYGAVQVQSVALPSYGETATSGSNQFALNYASQTVTTTRTELGARFDKRYLLDQGAALTFYSRAAWAHDSGNNRSASAIFQALPASNFTVNAAQPNPDSALLSAGAEYKMANGWSVLAKFDGEFSKTTSLYSGAGEIRKAW